MARRIAVMILLILVCSGCTGHTAQDSSGASTQLVNFVKPEIRDISSVLVLEGLVVPEAEYQVTSPSRGQLTSVSDDAYQFNDGLSALLFRLPERSKIESVRIDPAAQMVTEPGYPLLDATYRGFLLSASVPPEILMRVAAAPIRSSAQIYGGGAPFVCELLDPFPSHPIGLADEGPYSYHCIIPSSETVITGMPGRLAIVTAEKVNVLSLPVEAVLGSVGSGHVMVRRGDSLEISLVELGISDGYYVEVLAGIDPEDEVSVAMPRFAGGLD